MDGRRWRRVKEDDPILSVMTDKATVEIPAPCDGTVKSMVGEAGDILPVGRRLHRFRR
jgi:2-oxoisovalerate dehydrogenase E2 component (dihydrolipoyl transacylase)